MLLKYLYFLRFPHHETISFVMFLISTHSNMFVDKTPRNPEKHKKFPVPKNRG